MRRRDFKVLGTAYKNSNTALLCEHIEAPYYSYRCDLMCTVRNCIEHVVGQG